MIQVLSKHVAAKIAAGEVIDRPVSIVKELLENSIDAGADNITVEIKNGGKSYIRVTDNGCGIAGEDTETAFKRHATSKITTEHDLDAVSTLGFRGEALASICAVSRVEMITKTEDEKIGHRIVVEGSEILQNTGTGCPTGTTVTVRDLFYNVPARRKFLNTDNGEARRIIEIVSKIAMAYGDIKITLINGTSNLFSTNGRGNILNNIINVYGSDTGKDLVPVEISENGFILKGFVSRPSASLSTRNKQIFCINGRVVSSRILERALDEAYRERLFSGRFPIAFLFLNMPAEKLDVNIHPTKKEVRFDDDFEVEDFVKKAVIKALAVKDAMPEIRDDKSRRAGAQKTVNDSFVRETKDFYRETSQVDIKNILSTLRNKQIEPDTETEYEIKNIKEQPSVSIPEEISVRPPSMIPFDFDKLTVIGSAFNTYIIACDSEQLYLIDQHAAHERILYEQLIHQYLSETKASQQLIVPLQFTVSAHLIRREDEWIEQLRRMGYGIEMFGAKTYIVREIPAFMELAEAEAFLNDVFGGLEVNPDIREASSVDKIIMRSCKSAVKGGDCLAGEETDALISELKNCINPFSCPHGRPVFIRLTKYEIEKMFKRV